MVIHDDMQVTTFQPSNLHQQGNEVQKCINTTHLVSTISRASENYQRIYYILQQEYSNNT